MEKEEKKRGSQNEDQEELLSNSEFGFVYDFFISEGKKVTPGKRADRGKPQEKRKSELTSKDQSVTFFLPDFFTYQD
ncbi:MAG: hypothetical protein NTX62_07980 [Deltaproteobacteria bacterium]|jgi:hypothetical protein|nr:hypothetical protein [Deltaproteobacteria bacterium]